MRAKQGPPQLCGWPSIDTGQRAGGPRAVKPCAAFQLASGRCVLGCLPAHGGDNIGQPERMQELGGNHSITQQG